MRETIVIDMDKVKELMHGAMWVWSDLAKAADVATATLYAIQAGSRKGSYKTLFKLAKALHVDPKELLKK